MKSKKYKFISNDVQQDNVIVLRKRKFPWWILLLLPLLLLIKCNRQIVVNCYESETGIKMSNQEVNLEYESHFVFNKGSFFPSETIKRKRITDNSGIAVFDSLPCSVYSYIFYCLSECNVFTQGDECHNDASVKCKFHNTDYVDLEIPRRREDLYVKLVDFYTGEPLPNGKLTYIQDGKTDSAFADERGVVILRKMLYCSDVERLTASCPEYLDTTNTNIRREKLVDEDYPFLMRLIKKETIPSPPERNCGVHFSGLILSDKASNVGVNIIFADDYAGEYVGSGYYPDNNTAFPKAVKQTFDAIAVDQGTRLILYSKPNYEGEILLDVVGPMLISNVKWKNDSRYNFVATKTFIPELQELFPPERRQWSNSDMWKWSNGSCKIICNK